MQQLGRDPQAGPEATVSCPIACGAFCAVMLRASGDSVIAGGAEGIGGLD